MMEDIVTARRTRKRQITLKAEEWEAVEGAAVEIGLEWGEFVRQAIRLHVKRTADLKRILDLESRVRAEGAVYAPRGEA